MVWRQHTRNCLCFFYHFYIMFENTVYLVHKTTILHYTPKQWHTSHLLWYILIQSYSKWCKGVLKVICLQLSFLIWDTYDPLFYMATSHDFISIRTFWIEQIRADGVGTWTQWRSQPHSPWWARVPLSLFFLKYPSLFLMFWPPGRQVTDPGKL